MPIATGMDARLLVMAGQTCPEAYRAGAHQPRGEGLGRGLGGAARAGAGPGPVGGAGREPGAAPLAGRSAALPLPAPLAGLQTAAAPGPRWILGVPVGCRWSKMLQLPALALA